MSEGHELTVELTKDDGEGKVGLMGYSHDLYVAIRERFEREYEVDLGDIDDDDDELTREITVRRGLRVGAGVTLNVEAGDDEAEVVVGVDTKLGSAVAIAVVFVFVVAGMGLAVLDVGPFAMLPGRKLGALLGALIGMVPGALLALGINHLLLGGQRAVNARLGDEVAAVVRDHARRTRAILSDPRERVAA